MAEKAQYFLEKSIPEIKEWEKKGIFTKVRCFLNTGRAAVNPQRSMKSQPSRKSGPTMNIESTWSGARRRIMRCTQSEYLYSRDWDIKLIVEI